MLQLNMPPNQQFHIITTDAIEGLVQTISDLTGLYQAVKEENDKLKDKLLLSPEEVAEKTPWCAQTIIRKKKEIGYVAMGKEISFEPENVKAWIKKYSIAPKSK